MASKPKMSRVTFRLPDALRRKAKEQSKEEYRSLNAHLIVLVERGLQAPRLAR